MKQTNEENIKKHYDWYLQSCNKYNKKPISYNQYKKEFIKMQENNKTPEEQKRLRETKKQLRKVMSWLK